LEHHWVLAQKELDQEKVWREKLQHETQDDFVGALKEEKENYAKVVKQHEARITELKQAHAKQCDELCREVLKANLEADRLHNQLNGGERKTKLFSEKSELNGVPFVLVVVSMFLAVSCCIRLNAENQSNDVVFELILTRYNTAPSNR
jgi:hypothetical protein